MSTATWQRDLDISASDTGQKSFTDLTSTQFGAISKYFDSDVSTLSAAQRKFKGAFNDISGFGRDL